MFLFTTLLLALAHLSLQAPGEPKPAPTTTYPTSVRTVTIGTNIQTITSPVLPVSTVNGRHDESITLTVFTRDPISALQDGDEAFPNRMNTYTCSGKVLTVGGPVILAASPTPVVDEKGEVPSPHPTPDPASHCNIQVCRFSYPNYLCIF